VKPEQLLYAKTHEWVRVETQNGEKIATVGISAFAIQALTDLVYMGLPEVGRQVSAGESFGEIESVKAVSDLYSPVDGEIVEVNQKLPDHLDQLSKDPYGDGWVVKVRIANDADLKNLLDYDAYQRQCAEQGE
jgi:glycine cleavage system H protein